MKKRAKKKSRKPIAPPTLVMDENKRKNKYRRKEKFDKEINIEESSNN